jgi:hypothetical protein
VDVPDPDGTILRFYWARENDETLRFTGLDFDADCWPTFYETPRLSVPDSP